MALQHLRSSTANKRPLPAGMSDGQLAINTNAASPGLFFKDSSGNLVKTGPVHVGTTAPNASPASGGATGNSTGELWLDTSVSPNQLKTWNGSAWVSDFPDEIPVAKLADGAARQLLQTDAAGTGVEWTSNVDVPGTLDVTSTATFDSIASHPLGSAGAPTITFTGDTNTGIYSPGADQLALSTNGTQRVLIQDVSQNTFRVTGTNAVVTADAIGSSYPGFRLAVNGSILAGLDGDSGTSASLLTYGAQPLIFGTNSAERLRITSAGLVGIGSSSPGYPLTVKTATGGGQSILDLNNEAAGNYGGLRVSLGNNDRECRLQSTYGSSFFTFYTEGATGGPLERVRIDDQGRLGIGTTSPAEAFTLGSGNAQITSGQLTVGVTSTSGLQFINDGTFGTLNVIPLILRTASAERARIDTSGRLLVGTSSVRTTGWTTQSGGEIFQELTNYGGITIFTNTNASEEGSTFTLGKSRGSTAGSNTIVANNDRLGLINFQGTDGTAPKSAAHIQCQVDGTPGTNDMPGRLVFSTTADGASSPTERMRITNSGNVLFGKTDTASATVGIAFQPSIGYGSFTRSGGAALGINRMTNDGELVQFLQDDNLEGSISVSGTTVSYNGAHLSRWSQLPSGAEREEILRGTVLSNIDEMCEWGEEHNEQLNRMKVSDVEGDKNVSGVFQAWDDDDDTYTNDFYCAMTGDFIIRIGAGVTIERGDLLMSAGDGTAKPQDDDIIRSKTIAKVTSTNVSCTYDDGSYCVPCVLMAC